MSQAQPIDLTDSDTEQTVVTDVPPRSDSVAPPPSKKAKLKRGNATVHSAAPQSRRWCFTLNNPVPGDREDVLGWNANYIVFQLEKGEEGTLHYQGTMFSTPADICYQLIHDVLDDGIDE